MATTTNDDELAAGAAAQQQPKSSGDHDAAATAAAAIDETTKMLPKGAPSPGGSAASPAAAKGEAQDQLDPAAAGGDFPLRVYRLRWFILGVVALLNNTNTMSWIAFAPVSNYANIYYANEAAAKWFSMVYMMMTIPVGVVAMWAGSRFGLRNSILIAAVTNGVGGLIRLSSSFVPVDLRFGVGIAGQAIAATAYPFIMFMPTKVAGSWFADNERALATTIGVMANPLGVLLASLISPQLVRDASHIVYLNFLTAIPSAATLVLAAVGVRSSTPPTPPTYVAAQKQMPFLPGLKACLSSWQYMVLFIVMGGGIGMFNCLYTIMQELLCPSGYSNSMAGICAALMISGGVVGAAASGVYVDRTKRYKETLVICMAGAVLCGIAFLQLTLHTDMNWALAICCLLFGILGLATYPVGLELSAECTFPVSEATSSGLIVLSGQIQSVLYVMLMNVISKPLAEEFMSQQVCTVGEGDTKNVPKDNTHATWAFSAIALALAIFLATCFRPVYKRIDAERQRNAATAANAVKLEPIDGAGPSQPFTSGEDGRSPQA